MAWIAFQALQCPFALYVFEEIILLHVRSVEPLKGRIGFAPKRVCTRNLVSHILRGVALGTTKGGIGVRSTPQRVEGHRKGGRPKALDLLLLDLAQR